jgi:hypothetical protein
MEGLQLARATLILRVLRQGRSIRSCLGLRVIKQQELGIGMRTHAGNVEGNEFNIPVRPPVRCR